MPPTLHVLDIIKPILHYIKFPKVWIDNSVFRLHAKVSVFFLFVGCMLITVGQFFGSPIHCIVGGGKIPESVMNTYCWIHSTFILPKNISMEIGTEVAHPGVGTYSDADEIVKNKYYQFVCFALFLQGVMFLVPYQLWKNWEGGKVADLTAPLKHNVSDARMPMFATPVGLLNKKIIQENVLRIKEYFVDKGDFLEHRYLLHKFALCEALNFVNVIFQIFFLDYFLGGVFSTYGSDVLRMSQMDPDKRMDPMDRVFPKVAKCNFYRYGPSGTIEKADGLCVLSLNIINEKIYILLWFWFVMLAVVSGIQLAWRLSTLTSGRVREQFLRGKSYLQATQEDVAVVCNNTTMGDWFLLILVSENIDTRIFSDLIRQLSQTFKKISAREQEA